jgi:pSer/pThr/pTyr-binding forkhead associated (FHA) protein
MGRIFLRMLVGGTAGLIAWALMEPLAPKSFYDPNWGEWSMKFVALIGALVGLAVGGLDGYYQGTRNRFIRGLILGFLFGAVGSTFGFGMGSVIAESVFGKMTEVTGGMATQMLARIVAFTFTGIFLGFAIGFSSLNFKKAIQGLVGGGLGAAIAGLMFDPVSYSMSRAILAAKGGDEVGIVGRVILSVVMGALIGLFIGIVERVARSAWVRLTLGRNEGKEWNLDSAQNFIGRDERAAIPLFGDQNVMPMHACIVRQGPNQWLLADGGSPVGTYLNGQRIQQAPLFHGAVITVGSYNLEFLMKNQAAPVRGPEAYPGQAYPIGGQQYGHPQQPVPVQPGPYNPQSPSHPVTQPPSPYPQAPGQPTQAYPQSPQPPTSAHQFTLIALDGPLSGQRFPIAEPTDVGREQASIPMSFDTQASRRHAQLIPDAMGLTVTDLNSTNGTFVNGQRVQSQTLRSGDIVKIGSTQFRVD